MGETAGGAGEWLVKHARHVQPGVALRSEIPLYSLAVPLENSKNKTPLKEGPDTVLFMELTKTQRENTKDRRAEGVKANGVRK